MTHTATTYDPVHFYTVAEVNCDYIAPEFEVAPEDLPVLALYDEPGCIVGILGTAEELLGRRTLADLTRTEVEGYVADTIGCLPHYLDAFRILPSASNFEGVWRIAAPYAEI